MLCKMLFLRPPAFCRSGRLRIVYLMLIICLQALFFSVAALFCAGFGLNLHGIKLAKFIIAKTLITLIFNSVTNIAITVQLPWRRMDFTTSHLPEEAWVSQLKAFRKASVWITRAWMLLHLFKSSTLLLAIGYIPLINLLGLFAYRLLFIRSQGAILYFWLENWKLRLQIDCVNRQLKRWCTLKGLLLLNQQHHMLMNALRELDLVGGPVIACHSFCCIVNLIVTSCDLVLPQQLNMNAVVIIWHVLTTITLSIDIICLANAGEKLAAAARQTIPICHKMCENLDKALILRERQELLLQYQLIAQESFQRNTKLHADGFFPVDHSMIILIVFNVCNNLVAICQFIAKQSL